MDSIEVIVIGAGVVGLACARALAQAGREVMVIETQPGIGMGISSRNSEVIHAGLYYEPGSLKARLCVQGRELMYAYCADRGVAHRRCGKLVVATREAERPALEAIRQRAQANGVSGLRWLSGADARALEPALHSVAALLSPDTGIVDSHGLMLALQGDAEAAGAMYVFNTRVVAADLTEHGAVVHTADAHAAPGTQAADADARDATRPDVDDASNDTSASLSARWVINSAGLDSPAVAAAIRGLPPHAVPRARYAKGIYFSLNGRAPFSRLIYPVPEPGGLGVHLTLDLGGQAKFGPDVEWIDAPDYVVDPQRAAAFYASIRHYWPALPDDALQPAYASVRPKLHGPGGHADFRIDGPAEHGAPGLVQLLGIESPGLTASMAIGEHVARIVARG